MLRKSCGCILDFCDGKVGCPHIYFSNDPRRFNDNTLVVLFRQSFKTLLRRDFFPSVSGELSRRNDIFKKSLPTGYLSRVYFPRQKRHITNSTYSVDFVEFHAKRTSTTDLGFLAQRRFSGEHIDKCQYLSVPRSDFNLIRSKKFGNILIKYGVLVGWEWPTASHLV